MNPLQPDFAESPTSPNRASFDYAPTAGPGSPVVSVITPFYNTDQVFLETAQSMMTQSLQQWEWLIVNDGSDQPEAVRALDSFRTRDPRVRVLDLPANRGLPAARNAGLKEALADKIFFLDSDDLIEPTTLEKLAWCLESYPEYGFCKGLTVGFGAQQYASRVGFEAHKLFLNRNPVTITAMVRQTVLASVDGFDESLRSGLEDWDFWLRCANEGHWGRTVHEYMDWFRRRTDHSERWTSWTAKGTREMRRTLKRRYPKLFTGELPRVRLQPLQPYASFPQELPFSNTLVKESPRILFILPWMAMGGADKFNLDAMRLLKERGFELSIATTLPDNYAWYQEFAQITPDIFVLPHFLRLSDYPRFLEYLIKSRQIDVALLSNSELGYKFLPYLRVRCPESTFVDVCHMEEEYWHSGGHPRSAAAYQDQLDLNIVSSHHLKEWMVGRGADASRIEVCYTNIDAERHVSNPETRSRVRAELQIEPETPILLYAGRLCEQKQPKVFARVMRELEKRKLEFVCLVAGDGEDRAWLTRYLRRNRLTKRVWMLGAVSHARMQELQAASDIFFLPSKMEGIALSIFEAMAMGLVTVGASVGGQPELVTPECGILIQRGTVEDEVSAYAEVLQNLIHSPEQRHHMGRAARARVSEHFQLEQMGDRMTELLALAQESHGSGAANRLALGLAVEHAVQAIEYERVTQAARRLWKYHPVEVVRQRLAWWLSGKPLLENAVTARGIGVLVGIKDALWIAGHKIKVRFGLRKSV
jgi:glycosyltransferase involved in cell wall biosynthesis